MFSKWDKHNSYFCMGDIAAAAKCGVVITATAYCYTISDSVLMDIVIAKVLYDDVFCHMGSKLFSSSFA